MALSRLPTLQPREQRVDTPTYVLITDSLGQNKPDTNPRRRRPPALAVLHDCSSGGESGRTPSERRPRTTNNNRKREDEEWSGSREAAKGSQGKRKEGREWMEQRKEKVH